MRFFRYLKEKVFSRKSGLRHLAALLLTFVVLVLTHVGMTLLTGEEYWFDELYWELFLGKNEQMLYGAIGVLNTNWGDLGNPCSLELADFGLGADWAVFDY